MDWSGEYHFRGFGVEAGLELHQDGQFVFSFIAPAGVAAPSGSAAPAEPQHGVEGSWSLAGEWVVLSPSIAWIRKNQKISRLQVKVDGSDQYLIPEGFNVSYLERGWKPMDTGFVRGGIDRRRALESERALKNKVEFIDEMNNQNSWCGSCDVGVVSFLMKSH